MNKKILLLIVTGTLSFYLFGVISVQYKLFPFLKTVKSKHSVEENTKPKYSENKTYKLFSIYQTEQADIIMLGDSITFGINWNELFNKPIINRGIGGDTTTGFLFRIEQVIKLKPKKVFIMGGINDIRRYKEVPYIFSNYKKIITILRKNNIIPYVQSTLLTNDHNYNSKVIELNILLKKYCETNNIQFIDLNKELSKNTLLLEQYTIDGIHLNADGYKVWRELIEDYIK